jgi:lipoprotein signal peptidase
LNSEQSRCVRWLCERAVIVADARDEGRDDGDSSRRGAPFTSFFSLVLTFNTGAAFQLPRRR